MNNLFISFPPTKTASDVLKIVEEVQERKRLLDSQLLAMLPNLVASYAIAVCEARAAVEGRSVNLKMNPSELYDKLPSQVQLGLLEGRESEGLDACRRILKPLGEQVQGILTHLGFTCAVASVLSLEIEISW
jgi:hypothetical protein